MPEVIKVGTSAWPIVFAAVVAQVFKAYATWRVERGIKLMQLEQLIGSNSFGSAIKQPMVLRQLDVLSLVLLLTWCLSPLGSSALQRTLYTGFSAANTTVEVQYLKQYGANKLFAANWNTSTAITDHEADNQMAAILFLSTLVPAEPFGDTHLTTNMDAYNHPYLKRLSSPGDFDAQSNKIAAMGLPLVLPKSPLEDIQDKTTVDTTSIFELITFNATSSYFEFTCGNFSIAKSGAPQLDALTWSNSYTLGMRFSDPGNTSTITHLDFASANENLTASININSTEDVSFYEEWEYSFIQCDFQQRFVNHAVICKRWLTGKQDTATWTPAVLCYSDDSSPIPEKNVTSENMSTSLEDFADDWTVMADPRNQNVPGIYPTPSKLPPLRESLLHVAGANLSQRKYLF